MARKSTAGNGGAFFALKIEEEMRLDMAEPKTIYCPRCGRIVCHYNGQQTINPIGKCKKCGKLVVYNIEQDEVSVANVPKRKQSSGMRFY